MVMMVLLPREVGRPVTKSRAMSDYSRPRMGKGRRSPAGGRWDALLREQMSQAAMNSRVSESRVGHQKRQRMNSAVRVAGQPAGVAPLKNLTPYGGWDEQAGDHTYHPGWREDGVCGGAVVRVFG